MAKLTIVLILHISAIVVEGVLLPECRPARPPKGGYAYERILKNGTRQTIFECDEGLTLRGVKVATCLIDEWNVPTPDCIVHDVYVALAEPCGPNATRVLCGRWCEPTCENPEHRLCMPNPVYCKNDCRCKDGYVRNRKGDCIEYDNCPDEETRPKHDKHHKRPRPSSSHGGNGLLGEEQ